ncbi:unnamed protein product [Durusdinium trenchii]|uniref:Uncharacterized protein n=2 Tax=Durusdinium trenchii TaxID=1381693 RepID=A0ABP0HSJ8_9DINO
MAVLVEISRQTVVRAETAVWSMLVLRSAAFHTLIYQTLASIASWLKSTESTPCSSQTRPSTSASTSFVPDFPLVLADIDQIAMAAKDLCLPLPKGQNDWNWKFDAPFCIAGTGFSGDATIVEYGEGTNFRGCSSTVRVWSITRSWEVVMNGIKHSPTTPLCVTSKLLTKGHLRAI